MKNFQICIVPKPGLTTLDNLFCGSIKVQLAQKTLKTWFYSPRQPRKEVQKCPIFRLWTPPEPPQGPSRPQHGMLAIWAWYGPTWATWVIESSRTMVQIFCPLLRLCVNYVRAFGSKLPFVHIWDNYLDEPLWWREWCQHLADSVN